MDEREFVSQRYYWVNPLITEEMPVVAVHATTQVFRWDRINKPKLIGDVHNWELRLFTPGTIQATDLPG